MPKQDRSPGRASYDLTPEIKRRIKEISKDLGVPQSQLAALLLLNSLANFEFDQADLLRLGLLKKSSSSAYQYTIDLKKIASNQGKDQNL